jgi:hypothetical protein
VWLVENSADFEIMESRIRWYTEYSPDRVPDLTFGKDSEGVADRTNLGYVICDEAFNNFPMFNDYKTDWIFDAAGVQDVNKKITCYIFHAE